jgi:hypothetical protein
VIENKFDFHMKYGCKETLIILVVVKNVYLVAMLFFGADNGC